MSTNVSPLCGDPSIIECRQKTVLVELKDVSVSFEQGSQVLQGIDLTLCAGESVLLLGASGCGKSTLSQVIAGLLPRSIEATVTGEVNYAPAVLQSGGVGIVFQDPEAQFCMVEVQDEVAFGLENLQMPPAEMDPIIHTSLQQFGLQVDGSATTTSLSGGMKQKLALACAFAMQPSFYLLDEPTANLDPASTQLVFEQVEELIRQGQTVVIIEHKFDALLPFVERVVLLDSTGRLHRTGPTLQVIAQEWEWLLEQGIVLPEASGRTGGDSYTQADTLASAKSSAPVAALDHGELRYGAKLVWQELTFTVQSGEWIAVLGENGAGKSSLLHALAGLKKLTAGSVQLSGKPLKKLSRADVSKLIAFVFQNPEHQFIYERVIDEISNRMVGDRQPDPEDLQLLAEFGLQNSVELSPFALSQGQKRRLSVACMLREHHRLYLLDEPTFGQDARTQLAILEKLQQLHQTQAAILMTTHDMEIVEQYATRVLVLGQGGLLFDGLPDELLRDRGLLQAANLFAPRLTKERASLRRGEAFPWSKQP
ncbi:MAG: cbiO [Bacilli bacterium]|nr:cbiO [Bacilli bacterium]